LGVVAVRTMLGVAIDLALKYALSAAALAVVLAWVGNLPLGDVLYAALWVAIATYLLGDLLVYRYAGDGWAPVAEAVVAATTVWVLSQALLARLPPWEALAAGAAVGAAEFAYHPYLARRGYRYRPAARGLR
jgi:hypothetical protein